MLENSRGEVVRGRLQIVDAGHADRIRIQQQTWFKLFETQVEEAAAAIDAAGSVPHGWLLLLQCPDPMKYAETRGIGNWTLPDSAEKGVESKRERARAAGQLHGPRLDAGENAASVEELVVERRVSTFRGNGEFLGANGLSHYLQDLLRFADREKRDRRHHRRFQWFKCELTMED